MSSRVSVPASNVAQTTRPKASRIQVPRPPPTLIVQHPASSLPSDVHVLTAPSNPCSNTPNSEYPSQYIVIPEEDPSWPVDVIVEEDGADDTDDGVGDGVGSEDDEGDRDEEDEDEDPMQDPGPNDQRKARNWQPLPPWLMVLFKAHVEASRTQTNHFTFLSPPPSFSSVNLGSLLHSSLLLVFFCAILSRFAARFCTQTVIGHYSAIMSFLGHEELLT